MIEFEDRIHFAFKGKEDKEDSEVLDSVFIIALWLGLVAAICIIY